MQKKNKIDTHRTTSTLLLLASAGVLSGATSSMVMSCVVSPTLSTQTVIVPLSSFTTGSLLVIRMNCNNSNNLTTCSMQVFGALLESSQSNPTHYQSKTSFNH